LHSLISKDFDLWLEQWKELASSQETVSRQQAIEAIQQLELILLKYFTMGQYQFSGAGTELVSNLVSIMTIIGQEAT